MIIKGSRYAEKPETRNEETRLIAVSSEYSTDSYYTIVSEQGDTFESIAGRYMNNPMMYWKLADINKNIGYPDYIPTGSSIKIPLK